MDTALKKKKDSKKTQNNNRTSEELVLRRKVSDIQVTVRARFIVCFHHGVDTEWNPLGSRGFGGREHQSDSFPLTLKETEGFDETRSCPGIGRFFLR